MIDFEHKEQFCADLLAELTAHRKATGLSETALSKKITGNDGLFKNLRTGSLPRPDKLQRIATELGWELYLGPVRGVDAGDILLRDLRRSLGLSQGAGPAQMREAAHDLRRQAASRVSVDGMSVEDFASELAVELARKFRPPTGYTEIGEATEDDQHHRDGAETEWTLPKIDALTKRLQKDATARGAPLTAEKLLKLVQSHVHKAK